MLSLLLDKRKVARIVRDDKVRVILSVLLIMLKQGCIETSKNQLVLKRCIVQRSGVAKRSHSFNSLEYALFVARAPTSWYFTPTYSCDIVSHGVGFQSA